MLSGPSPPAKIESTYCPSTSTAMRSRQAWLGGVRIVGLRQASRRPLAAATLTQVRAVERLSGRVAARQDRLETVLVSEHGLAQQDGRTDRDQRLCPR